VGWGSPCLRAVVERTEREEHYVRKSHPRCDRMKNGDAQITRLHHHVLHYRVIGDTRPDASPISIHWRCAKSERVFDYKTHPRRMLRVRVTNLILGWNPYGTNTRHAWGSTSPITKKSETRYILTRHRFIYQLGSLWH
jgi:hypothetical protein